MIVDLKRTQGRKVTRRLPANDTWWQWVEVIACDAEMLVYSEELQRGAIRQVIGTFRYIVAVILVPECEQPPQEWRVAFCQFLGRTVVLPFGVQVANAEETGRTGECSFVLSEGSPIWRAQLKGVVMEAATRHPLLNKLLMEVS